VLFDGCFQTSVLADVGGYSLEDFIKRSMKTLLTEQLARSFSVTGQGRKNSFKQLLLFKALSGLITFTLICHTRITIHSHCNQFIGVSVKMHRTVTAL